MFSRFFFNVAKVMLLLVVQEKVEKRPKLRSSNACQRDTVDVNSRFRNFFLAEDDDDDGSFVVSSKQLEAS